MAWVGALVKEGDKFRASMVQHEMKHKRMRAQTIFSTTGGLKGQIGNKLRQWMRDHTQEDSPTLDPIGGLPARRKRVIARSRHYWWLGSAPFVTEIGRVK
jgi:hypothetical protein